MNGAIFTAENAESAEMTSSESNDLTGRVIGCAIDVHRELGPGLLESAYEAAFCFELSRRQIVFEKQKPTMVIYKGHSIDCGYRLDLCIAGRVIVELKAVEKLLPIHEAQLLTYLRLSKLSVGLLINFNVPVLREGVRRLVNNFPDSSADSAFSAVNS